MSRIISNCGEKIEKQGMSIMSMVIHLGLNFEVPISVEYVDEPIEIDTNREEGLIVQERHVNTPYIYEIFEGAKYEPV